MSPKDGARGTHAEESWDPDELQAFAPGMREAQNAWMAQIDSLRAPDRKTHELIRMVCAVVQRNPRGVTRHAMLAAEVGASWEDVGGSIMLTEPAFGLLNALEALPWARQGYERGRLEAPGASKPAKKVPAAKRAR